jgi:hypothetical protein
VDRRRAERLVLVDRDAVTCEECGAVAAGGAERWRAYVIGDEIEAIDDPMAGDARVLFRCPECVDREFRDA